MATKQPTEEQWAEIREALTFLYKRVVLQVDDYQLSLILERMGLYNNQIAVYVNDRFMGSWLLNDCPERRRFLRPVTFSLWDKKTRTALVKLYGKREAEKQGAFKKGTCYAPGWKSFSRLKAHLVKHNENIELVKIGYE